MAFHRAPCRGRRIKKKEVSYNNIKNKKKIHIFVNKIKFESKLFTESGKCESSFYIVKTVF